MSEHATYERLLPLGTGGMASVWLAVRRDRGGNDELLVLKSPHREFASDARFRRMLVDEARLATTLRHPNIVRTLEIHEDQGELHLVMEYLEGRTLDWVRERSRPPLEVTLRVLMDVLRALDHAHACTSPDGLGRGVVHRDVSPDNILVTFEGPAKLMDFGIARALGTKATTGLGEIKGKAAYMPPEQLEPGGLDHRADVFAVGVLLFEALTGHRMWGELGELAILRRLHAHDIPRLPPSVVSGHPALSALCQRALAADPSRRFTSAGEFHDALARVVPEGALDAQEHPVARFMEQRFAADRLEQRRRIEAAIAGLKSSAALVPQSAPAIDGPYTIVQQLGPGRYEAMHRRLRSKAIVQVDPRTEWTDVKNRMERLAAIRHPALGRLLLAGPVLEGKGSYFVHERSDSPRLAELPAALLEHPLGALDVLGELLDGVAELHRRGLCHGAIDDETVSFLSAPGGLRPKLSCPGLRRRRQSPSRYVAPQVAAGNPPSPSSDVYALGVLAYDLVSGVRGSSSEAWRPTFDAPGWSDPSLQRWVERALAPDEDVRYADAIEMLAAAANLDRAALSPSPAAGKARLDLAPRVGRRASPVHAPRWAGGPTERPTVWLLRGDPAIRDPNVLAAFTALDELADLSLIEDDKSEAVLEDLRAGRTQAPWVVIFGDLQVMLGDPTLSGLAGHPEVSKLLVSTHPNLEMLQMSINGVGLDRQICLPTTPDEIIASIASLLERVRGLKHEVQAHRDTLHRYRRESLRLAAELGQRNSDVGDLFAMPDIDDSSWQVV